MYFFFQAEDGIRDRNVTGVQTCALPIFYFKQPISATAAMNLLDKQPGVELVLNRAASAKLFDLPADRIGDLVVVADRGTVLGKSKATLDVSGLGGMRLRSHGGLADRNVYLMFSRPLNDKYAEIA